jgi:hypothetical protein
MTQAKLDTARAARSARDALDAYDAALDAYAAAKTTGA